MNKRSETDSGHLSTIKTFFLLLQIKGLNGASLKMWVVANGNTAAPPLSTSPSPIKTAFVNLMTIPGSRLRSSVGEKFAATVLLENPVGENFLTYEELVQEVSGPMFMVTGAQ